MKDVMMYINNFRKRLKIVLKIYKEYRINTILASFFSLAFIIYLSSKSFSDFLIFYHDWNSIFYLILLPFISIIILKLILDEEYIEAEIKKDSTFILIGSLMMTTLILTLFNPTSYNEVTYYDTDMEIEEIHSELIDQKQIHYPMMYLIICALFSYLSKHEKVKTTFALTSVILMFMLLVDLMNFKDSTVISMSRSYLIANWDIIGDGPNATILRILKIVLPLSLLYMAYQLIGKNKL